jgi:hypothetical protein
MISFTVIIQYCVELVCATYICATYKLLYGKCNSKDENRKADNQRGIVFCQVQNVTLSFV